MSYYGRADPDHAMEDRAEQWERETQALEARSQRMALGTLSESESALAAHGMNPLNAEAIAELLYYQLDIAMKRRLFLDRAKQWDGDYARVFREREQAISAATRHYRTLLNCAPAFIDSYLAQMVLSEGLMP